MLLSQTPAKLANMLFKAKTLKKGAYFPESYFNFIHRNNNTEADKIHFF